MSAAPHTVVEVIIYCGVDNPVLFEGNPKTKRIATDMFDNDFNGCVRGRSQILFLS